MTAVGAAAFATPLVLGYAVLFGILRQRAEPAPYDPRVRHRVTERMVSETERMATKLAPTFAANDVQGRRHTLAEFLEKGPVLVTFINVDCPCSRDAEPMYQALADAYPGITVVGVAGASSAEATKWAKANHCGHLVLADTDLRIVHAYGAISSVYTALITPLGKIVKMWPGYSQAMMQEVSDKAADLLGVSPVKLPTKLAPAEMAAGCAFPNY